jgi:putative PEP-CTERM system TPR-repeat lipoprotein
MQHKRHIQLTNTMAAIALACLLSMGMAGPGFAQKPVQKLLDAHYELAIELVAKGDYKGGISELRLALKTDPKDIAARILLGNTLLEIQDGATAAEELLQARKDGALDSFVSASLARAYVLQGRYKAALAELKKAEENQSTAGKVAAIRGDAHLGLRHFRSAEKHYRKSLKIRPGYSNALNGLVRTKLARQDLPGANRYIKRALAADSNDPQAWFLNGEIARLENKVDDALSHYGKAAELAPRFVLPRLARARIVIGRGDYEGAQPDIAAVTDIDAKNPYAAFLQALTLAHNGKVKQAQDRLGESEIFLQQLPANVIKSHPPSEYLRGVFSYFRKDYTKAYRHLTAYLKRSPRDHGAEKLLASLALSKGDSDYALHLLEKLAPSVPQDIEVQTLFGDALMRAKRYSDAATVLEKAAALADPAFPALSRLVMLRGVASQNAAARDQLKSGIRRNPKAVKAALLMSATLLNQREYAPALEIALDVLEHDSKNAAAYNLAGGAQLAMKDIDAARRSFRAAFEAVPSFVLAISNLAKLELKLGNQRVARTLYSAIIEQDNRNSDAMMALADLEQRRKNYARSVHWLETARHSARNPQPAVLRLIDLYLVTNKPDKALSVARELHGREPDSIAYLSALGRTLVAVNRIKTARSAFKEVANRAVKMASADWLVKNAGWQVRSHDRAGARDALQQALTIDNRNLSVHVALYRLDMAAGKIEAALTRASKIVALDKSSPIGNILIGDAHMQRRKYNVALAAYEVGFKKKQGFVQAERVYQARRAAQRGAVEFVRNWAEQHATDIKAQLLLAAAAAAPGRRL